MTQRDNWGWQARIGMFIVGSEVVPEAEWWAMVPLNVLVHAARVTARAPWAHWRDDRSGRMSHCSLHLAGSADRDVRPKKVAWDTGDVPESDRNGWESTLGGFLPVRFSAGICRLC
jgi:hypothetical protein